PNPARRSGRRTARSLIRPPRGRITIGPRAVRGSQRVRMEVWPGITVGRAFCFLAAASPGRLAVLWQRALSSLWSVPTGATPPPALDDSGFQVDALNSAGRLTGFFCIPGVHAGHAFVYSDGDLVEAGTLGGSFSDGLAINASGWIVGQSDVKDDAASHAFAFD